MPVTAIISFTNMSTTELELASTENPNRDCNSCSARPGTTVWRDPETSMTGQTSQCCNIWVPHCTSNASFPGRHIEVRRAGATDPMYYIWQENQADGDFVRFSSSGYENPAPPIPGSARVTGDRDCGLTIDRFGAITLWDPDPNVEIHGLPAALHDEHMNWHLDDATTRHTGTQFLQFHRDFLAKFRAWYDAQPGANPGAVAAWPTLPPEFKQPGDPQAAANFSAVRDVETHLYKYPNAESFGNRLRGELHRWLHHVPITTIDRDVLITNFTTAPRSRHFYQLHGLIDTWWRRWTAGHAAALGSQTAVPSEVDPGQKFTVQVTFQNTGRTDWPAGGPIRLGSLDPADNTTWGTRRVSLTNNVPQPKYDPATKTWTISTATFVIAATAPQSPGRYGFRWRPLYEGVTWFGDPSQAHAVTVRTPPGKTKVPGVVGLSRAEAFADIRDAGLKPAATGGGNTVAKQVPTPGSVVTIGTTVTCTLRGGPTPVQES